MEELSIRDVDKKDALMLRGFAILSMLILHLFCRTGSDVYGTPLLWLDSETPFVYWFGFFAEICVTLYSLGGGYGVYISGKNNKLDFKNRALRCLKLLGTYWIVDIIFCGLGLLFDKTGQIPGTFIDFLKSIILLHSYAGAWWYLTTYIIIIMLFAPILYKLANKTNFWLGMSVCGILQVIIYFTGKFDLIPGALQTDISIVNWIYTQLIDLPGPLVAFFAGALMCKYQIVKKLRLWFCEHVDFRYRNMLLLTLFIVDFLAINIIHKAVLTFFNALAMFLLFHLWDKGRISCNVFSFLGRHSTVIWLSHMFFYLYLFEGLVQKAQYPLFMLLFMLMLTIMTSYLVEGIKLLVHKIILIKI